jgi:hypothetical protein
LKLGYCPQCVSATFAAKRQFGSDLSMSAQSPLVPFVSDHPRLDGKPRRAKNLAAVRTGIGAPDSLFIHVVDVC